MDRRCPPANKNRPLSPTVSGSAVLSFVISTGAQRSGGTCGFLLGTTMVANATKPLAVAKGFVDASKTILLSRTHRYTARRLLILFLLIRLTGSHGLVAPLVKQRHIRLVRGFIAAIKVSLTAIQQAQVRHRIIVAGTKIDGLRQFL